VIERTFAARLDAHYLLQPAKSVGKQTLLVVTLHGFGANAETMLGLTARLFEGSAAIAAVQGPNQFFLSTRAQDVGYGWVTNRHSAESVRLHHDMVRHVLDEAGGEFGIPPQRRVLVGFSQPVGLNYRFAATHPEAIGGVIGICGGVPSDWETGKYSPVSASVLHIARRHDEFYAPAVTEKYAERLRLRARDVEFHLLDGGHAVPSAGASIVTPWLERLLVAQGA
jgi:predicted esterase